jgi:hypothetical protein
MKRNEIACAAILLLLVAGGAVAQAPPEPPPSVTFGEVPVVVGDSWTESSTYTTTTTLALNDGYRDLDAVVRNTSVEQEKTVTVKEVVGNDRITAVEVVYTMVKLNGTDLTSTFAGKTYLVTVTGNKAAVVTYAAGGSPSDAEVAFVASDNNRLGQMRAMNKTFGGKSVAIAQLPYEMRASDPTELIDAEAGMTVRDFKMVLTNVTGEGEEQTASFDVVLELSSGARKPKGAAATDPDPFDTSSMTLDLTGVLVADVTTGRIASISLSGPATITARKNDPRGKKGGGSTASERFLSVAGTGAATMESSYTYP